MGSDVLFLVTGHEGDQWPDQGKYLPDPISSTYQTVNQWLILSEQKRGNLFERQSYARSE